MGFSFLSSIYLLTYFFLTWHDDLHLPYSSLLFSFWFHQRMLPRLEWQNVISHSAHADETHPSVDRQFRIISLGELSLTQGARSVVSEGEKNLPLNLSNTVHWHTCDEPYVRTFSLLVTRSFFHIVPMNRHAILGLMIFANCLLFYSSWLWTVGQICSALGVWTFTDLSFYAVRIALACLEGFIVSNYVVKLLCWCISRLF